MVYRLPIPPRIPLKTQLAASIVQRIRGGLFGEFDVEVGTVLSPGIGSFARPLLDIRSGL